VVDGLVNLEGVVGWELLNSRVELFIIEDFWGDVVGDDGEYARL